MDNYELFIIERKDFAKRHRGSKTENSTLKITDMRQSVLQSHREAACFLWNPIELSSPMGNKGIIWISN